MADVTIAQIAGGSVAAGDIDADDVIEMEVDGVSCFATVGNLLGAGRLLGFGLPQTGGGTFTAATEIGAVAWGNALVDVGTIAATAEGSTAFGFADGDGTALIESSSAGGLAFGHAGGHGGVGSVASIKASGSYGAFAGGKSYAQGGVTSTTLIEADSGGIAYGYMYAGGGGVESVTLRAGLGGAAFGYAYTGQEGNAVLIEAASGGMAFGNISGGYTDSVLQIFADKGGLAFGYIAHSGDNTDQAIVAAVAAIAFGYAYGYNIQANGTASFAGGSAESGDIITAANGAFQWGPGTNDVEGSLRVGSGPWLMAGVPGAPANGQIWVDAGVVKIRSNGATVSL